MPPIVIQNLFRTCLIGGYAGDAIDDFLGRFPGLFDNRFSLDHKGLTYMGKIEMLIQCCRGPDLPRLNPSMVAVARVDEVGRFGRVLEIEGQIFKQIGLVPFHREMIVRPSILHQITSELTLREQCIRRNGSAFYLNGIEQGCRRFYLIGPFFLVTAFYWKRADFFGRNTDRFGGQSRS